MTITPEQQIAAVRRELAMRKSAYPKWVSNGRMKQEEADHQLAAMQAVHDTLTSVFPPAVEAQEVKTLEPGPAQLDLGDGAR